MKNDSKNIKNFYYYMVGALHYNRKQPPDNQRVRFSKSDRELFYFNEEFDSRRYAAMRADSFLLRESLYTKRVREMFGPDRRRLLRALANIEGYMLTPKTSINASYPTDHDDPPDSPLCA